MAGNNKSWEFMKWRRVKVAMTLLKGGITNLKRRPGLDTLAASQVHEVHAAGLGPRLDPPPGGPGKLFKNMIGGSGKS